MNTKDALKLVDKNLKKDNGVAAMLAYSFQVMRVMWSSNTDCFEKDGTLDKVFKRVLSAAKDSDKDNPTYIEAQATYDKLSVSKAHELTQQKNDNPQFQQHITELLDKIPEL